ncbi:CPBP family intramembrane glutamic endopeptidase [Anaeromicropila herbilytica]|nr:CPBP family intramembrane glutamic endopeptidase [Anaeromicropila herbilytica]
MKKEKKSIIIFLIATFILSSVCYYIYIKGGEAASGITALLMWCPGVVAIIIRNIYYKKEKVLGFNRCNIRYIILGIFIPMIYLGGSYGIYWLLTPKAFTSNIYSNSIGLMICAVFSSVLTAMGEEIGWRGFLLPKMDLIMSRKKAIILCGLIWAVWHYPLMITGLYQSGTPLWYQLPLFTIEIILVTSVMAYLRFQSESVWPAIILHASHNYIDQLLCGPLTNSKSSPYFAGETGFVTVFFILIIIIVIYNKQLKNQSNQLNNF